MQKGKQWRITYYKGTRVYDSVDCQRQLRPVRYAEALKGDATRYVIQPLPGSRRGRRMVSPRRQVS